MYSLKVPKFDQSERITGIACLSENQKQFYDKQRYCWDWTPHHDWQENEIPAHMIESALNHGKFYKRNSVQKTWQECLQKANVNLDQFELFDDDEWEWTHATRIANLIANIKKGCLVKPILVGIDFDTGSFLIWDGNHRIRALQYLGFEGFPCIVYVAHSHKELVQLAVDHGYLIPSLTNKRLKVRDGEKWINV